MNFITILKRNLSYYRASHLSVLVGVIISFMTLTGALTIGDSIRFSLKKAAENRIGGAEFAVLNHSGFFAADLSDRLNRGKLKSAPALVLKGYAVKAGGRIRKNNITVIGVDDRFFEFGPGSSDRALSFSDNSAIINQKLSLEMKLQPGDDVLINVFKTSFIPGDISIHAEKGNTQNLNLNVKMIADENAFGNFSLNSHQISPLNIFVSHRFLAKKMNLAGFSNLLLVKGVSNIEELNNAIEASIRLKDMGLEIKRFKVPDKNTDVFEITSKKLFIDHQISDAILSEFGNTERIFTYFVNAINHGDRQTPYSFITGSSGFSTGNDPDDDKIIINKWLAEDLDAGVGDAIDISYFVFDSFRKLREETARFTVESIAPVRDDILSTSLAPDIPGLSDAADCREWDSGIPIDLTKIREKDEKYWDLYKGAPKAFISLPAAEKLWKNRYGNLTAIRIHENQNSTEITRRIAKAIKPEFSGLFLRNIKKDAHDSVKNAVDFGQLFLGLSFFLILSAFTLASLFAILLLEKRGAETGTLLSMGYSEKRIRRMFLREFLCILTVGAIVGSILGICFNICILKLLGTIWRGAVGQTTLYFSYQPTTLLTGLISGISISLITLLVTIRKNVKSNIIALQSQMIDNKIRGKTVFINKILFSICFISALMIVLITKNESPAGYFFAAGFLMLASGCSFFYLILIRLGKPFKKSAINTLIVSIKNCARKPKQSMSVFFVLACGVFIIISVGANRRDPLSSPGKRESGTGGFSHIIETSIPVLHDLNSKKGKKIYGLNHPDLKELRFTQTKTIPGEDASCLNLNRARLPVVIGVDTDEFSRLNAFTFSHKDKAFQTGDAWLLLNREIDGSTIPAAADYTTIVWGLGKRIGDILIYKDGRGNKLNLKLVAGLSDSIFQGKLLISLKLLREKFPGASGSHFILVDQTPKNDIEEKLTYGLRDVGADVIETKKRLGEFSVVQNTYLSIFLALGGLGLILGVFGLGTIIFRNIIIRKREMALLSAIGFDGNKIKKMLFAEFGFIFIFGILSGGVSAFIAVMPALFSPGYTFPAGSMLLFILLILITGAMTILLSVNAATGKRAISHIMDE